MARRIGCPPSLARTRPRIAAWPVASLASLGGWPFACTTPPPMLMPMEGLKLRRGDSFHHDGAGGGYGDPFIRGPMLVLEDVLGEKVSVEGARRDYGVAIDPVALAVDTTETTRLRAARAG